MAELVEQIEGMRGTGMSNNQIIDSLQKRGFSSSQIFDALSGVRQASPSLNTAQSAFAPMNPIPQSLPPVLRAPQQLYPQADTEEMIEAIIDEKWNDLMGDINKVIAWKDATEDRITRIEQQLDDVRDQFGKLQQAIVAKVGEYDQHILDVGAEVKAMEKVFSKVLPVFTDNVAELTRVTDRLKRQSPDLAKR
jgi:DNA-binding transcriptional MerR regulator